VVKNVPGSQITVVGGSPDWFNGHYIPIPQNKSKYRNAIRNIMGILESQEIPNDFILMNDDFFILKRIEEIPVLYRGNLNTRVQNHLGSINGASYYYKLKYTNNKLLKMKLTQLDYELHTPFNFNKEKLNKIFVATDQNILWRSYYGNYYNIGGTLQEDVKIYSGNVNIKNNTFISTDDDSFNIVKDLIVSKFSRPSRFEKF